MSSQYEILIVDDSRFIIKLLQQILKLKGLTCKAVESISAAKEELCCHKPKLIFLDVNLPDSNGFEFCRQLKKKKKFRNILIYFFTGLSEAEVAIKALETKADGYLIKPFDLNDFNDIFEHIKQDSSV
ncbi:MAG: two-component system response regulator [Promethearchaeota archaeon]